MQQNEDHTRIMREYNFVAALLETKSLTKRFYKNEIHMKEFIIIPSFIFTKNELLHSFF